MRIIEIEASLPNGFHDALLRTFAMDTVGRSLDFVLDISVGAPEAATSAARDSYRSARLTMSGVSHFSIDPPIPDVAAVNNRPPRIDMCDADDVVVPPAGIPDGAFAARFFVTSWNAFIHFVANDVTLIWLEPA